MASKFSQRHYEAIAELLRGVDDAIDEVEPDDQSPYQADQHVGVHEVRMALVELFKQDNPRFNPDKFVKASYPPDMAALLDKLDKVADQRKLNRLEPDDYAEFLATGKVE